MLFGIETLGHIAPLPSRNWKTAHLFDAKMLRECAKSRLMQPCLIIEVTNPHARNFSNDGVIIRVSGGDVKGFPSLYCFSFIMIFWLFSTYQQYNLLNKHLFFYKIFCLTHIITSLYDVVCWRDFIIISWVMTRCNKCDGGVSPLYPCKTTLDSDFRRNDGGV